MKDRFPSLPPGCTPSDIDQAFGESACPECGQPEHEGHARGCPLHPDEPDLCAVCNPPSDMDGPDPSTLPYCDSHGPDDFRAKMEHERKIRHERMTNDLAAEDDGDDDV